MQPQTTPIPPSKTNQYLTLRSSTRFLAKAKAMSMASHPHPHSPTNELPKQPQSPPPSPRTYLAVLDALFGEGHIDGVPVQLARPLEVDAVRVQVREVLLGLVTRAGGVFVVFF